MDDIDWSRIGAYSHLDTDACNTTFGYNEYLRGVHAKKQIVVPADSYSSAGDWQTGSFLLIPKISILHGPGLT